MSKLYDYQNALTAEDLAALEACDPDEVVETIRVSSSLDAILGGPGTYDHFERAGWVKREEPKVEEWAPWVKLAKVGERPDGVEFGEGESVEMKHCDGGKFLAHARRDGWLGVTRYRRKRIRCVYEAFGRENDLYKGHCIWTINDEGIDRPDEMPSGHYCLRGSLWIKATVPEVTAAKAGRDPNGVIAWHGGECPIGRTVRIVAHYRNGAAQEPWPADDYGWGHDGNYGDIIAYEVTP